MKQKSNYTISVYDIGTEVYAISRWYENGRQTDHIAIYKAKVESWSFDGDQNSVLYCLSSIKNGRWWGDNVEESYVSSNMEELIERAKHIWEHEEE